MISVAKPILGPEEHEAIARVLNSGVLSQGPEVVSFEQEFGDALGGDLEVVAVNSGTSALHLMLLALGIGRGDEVIVPSFSFAATANAVVLAGATPVFADICEATFTLDPEAVAAAISPRTRAVMPVHLYGHPAAMVPLRALCESSSLLLLEDAAQAHLAKLNGEFVGTLGDGSAFSFYPTKNMTTAEGGAVTTKSATTARRVRLLRNQGQERRYENEIAGYNNRMSEIHAAIGRVQLKRVHSWTNKRRENAAFLLENIQGPVLPYEAIGAVHVYHQFTIRVPKNDREAIRAELRDRGVETGVS